jgi:hypothetical protein
VRADSPYKTIGDLIASARQANRPLQLGNYSAGYQLVAAWLGTASGLAVTHIPYKGGAQMLTDVVGGQLEVGVIDFGGTLELMKGGRLRVLAITGDKREPKFPDIPTMKKAASRIRDLGVVGILRARRNAHRDRRQAGRRRPQGDDLGRGPRLSGHVAIGTIDDGPRNSANSSCASTSVSSGWPSWRNLSRGECTCPCPRAHGFELSPQRARRACSGARTRSAAKKPSNACSMPRYRSSRGAVRCA